MSQPTDPSVREHPFSEPWEAKAQAIAQCLIDAGKVEPGEWAEALGAAIKRAQANGDPDTGATYYTHVLDALEVLVDAKGLTTRDALTARKRDWARAYETTPHGAPVTVSAPGA